MVTLFFLVHCISKTLLELGVQEEFFGSVPENFPPVETPLLLLGILDVPFPVRQAKSLDTSTNE